MDALRFHLKLTIAPDVSVSVELNDRCGLHAGIVYLSANGLRKLHFGWHRYLFDVPYDGKACAIPLLEKPHAEWIATYCGKIAKNARNRATIPYNLKYDEDVVIDGDGQLHFGPDSTGVNCATFVLAVFRSASNPLVTMAGWPGPSAEDIVIQRGFVNELLDSQRPDDQQQGRVVHNEIGTRRVGPHHVAGSCLENDYPVPFQPCDSNGSFVEREVRARG